VTEQSRQYGPDGHGPPPTPEVAKIRDEFFGDGPPPHDPEVAAKALAAIQKRAPVWRQYRRDL
jgi:hypothetical protein